MTGPNVVSEDSIAERIRFLKEARRFGFGRLAKSPGLLVSLIVALPFAVLTAAGTVDSGDVSTISVAFLGLGVALVGIVLAGLAIVSTFFDRRYAAIAHRLGLFQDSLFMFWWVAALAVVAICMASLTLLVALVTTCRVLLTASVGISALTFFAALFESLSLIGHLIRQAMYRAEVAESGLTVEDLDDHDQR